MESMGLVKFVNEKLRLPNESMQDFAAQYRKLDDADRQFFRERAVIEYGIELYDPKQITSPPPIVVTDEPQVVKPVVPAEVV